MPANSFSYDTIDPNAAAICQGAAARIKSRSRQTARLAIEIGRDLIDAKEALPHGQWLPWLEAEFGWSESTAQRYIRLAKTFKSVNLTDLNISLSALHLLASGTIDPEDRDAALDLARENGGLSYSEARDLIHPAASPAEVPDGPLARKLSRADLVDDELGQLPLRGDLVIDESAGEEEDPDTVYEFHNSLPLGRMTMQRVTERERITETVDLEFLENGQSAVLPERLQTIIYFDPVMSFYDQGRMESYLTQLHELYQLLTGRPFVYRPQLAEVS